MDEVAFPGGNVGGAVRVGDTVRRPTGTWTPAIHALLEFLNAAGLDGIPRVLGVDDTGREILTYLPGRSIAVDTDVASDAVLANATRWLRRYHDTVRGFRPSSDVRWRNDTSAVRADEIVCHNDPGAYNWIVDGDTFVGMVDWDMAGPGRPIDDLAFMAWTGVPLFRPVPSDDVARRLAIMADAYGDFAALEILWHADTRLTRACNTIEAGQRRGDPGMVNLAKVGEPARTRALIVDLRGRVTDITAALSSA